MQTAWHGIFIFVKLVITSFTYIQFSIKWFHLVIQLCSENVIFFMLKQFNTALIEASMAIVQMYWGPCFTCWKKLSLLSHLFFLSWYLLFWYSFCISEFSFFSGFSWYLACSYFILLSGFSWYLHFLYTSCYSGFFWYLTFWYVIFDVQFST